jgi:hypothetical protein
MPLDENIRDYGQYSPEDTRPDHFCRRDILRLRLNAVEGQFAIRRLRNQLETNPFLHGGQTFFTTVNLSAGNPVTLPWKSG